MRSALTLLFSIAATFAFSQTNGLTGIYEADWGGPSYRYLLLDCDSTYHFITRWDIGARKDIEPPMTEKKRWRVEATKLILEVPIYKIKSLEIRPDGTLYKKGRNTWTRIIAYDQNCSVTEFKEIYSEGNYILTRFSPGLIILTSETFENGKLKERITYFSLTQEEIAALKTFKYPQEDPINDLRMKKAGYEFKWPKKKIERWENEVVTTTFFDKTGTEIEKSDQ